MVKNHRYSEKRNSILPIHDLLFPIGSHLTDRITHTTTFVTSTVEHWLEQEIAQWVNHQVI